MTVQTAFDVDAVARTIAAADLAAFGELLADDVEWREIDQGTPPAAPAVVHGREAVLANLRDAHEARGITTQIVDGFAAGDRAALQLVCSYPSGEQVVCNALLLIRDGRIARFSGVQAWDG
jgi:ketosteroid isomerase-like protein